MVPVNYGMRFSSGVTPSSCRRRPICHPGAVAGYGCKGSLVPRRFSLRLPLSFSPPSCPARLLLPWRVYDRANEKNGSAQPPACVLFVRSLRAPQHPFVSDAAILLLIRPPLDPTFLAGGLALPVTSMACLVFPVAGCPLVRWP